MRSPFSTRLLQLGLLAAVFVGSATGCQSTRPSFSFQPAPRRAAPEVVAGTAPTEPAQAAPVAVAGLAVAQSSGHSRQRVRRPRPALQVESRTVVSDPVLRPATARKRLFWARPQAQAEAGLGTTVLGILGLILLPVALVGLALSGGGLVWGIVAGAAAVAVLVAYIDPFGR
jgi:hypothetical protein